MLRTRNQDLGQDDTSAESFAAKVLCRWQLESRLHLETAGCGHFAAASLIESFGGGRRLRGELLAQAQGADGDSVTSMLPIAV